MWSLTPKGKDRSYDSMRPERLPCPFRAMDLFISSNYYQLHKYHSEKIKRRHDHISLSSTTVLSYGPENAPIGIHSLPAFFFLFIFLSFDMY